MENIKYDWERNNGKQAQREKNINTSVRQESQRNGDESTVRKSPDVNRIVDEIFQKYNDFGWADRD